MRRTVIAKRLYYLAHIRHCIHDLNMPEKEAYKEATRLVKLNEAENKPLNFDIQGHMAEVVKVFPELDFSKYKEENAPDQPKKSKKAKAQIIEHNQNDLYFLFPIFGKVIDEKKFPAVIQIFKATSSKSRTNTEPVGEYLMSYKEYTKFRDQFSSGKGFVFTTEFIIEKYNDIKFYTK